MITPVAFAAEQTSEKDLAHQIFETMLQLPGTKTGFRVVHAKGIVCQGTFISTGKAASLSKAAHFQPGSVPVTVRFSDGSSDPSIGDNSPDGGPRGMAIRFALPGGGETDIVAISHNGFLVGDGEEFLALEKAIVTTDPAKPHPWPIENFIGARPAARKFVEDIREIPTSFATESFFANNAFIFVNKQGGRQAGRYQILPMEGRRVLSPEDAKAKSPGFLGEDLKTRLATGPIKYRLVVQLANSGDSTKDPTVVWPADRKTLEVGTIVVASAVGDSAAAQKKLAFDPTDLTDGIELSDDPLPPLRSKVYRLAARYRQKPGTEARAGGQ